MSKLHLPRKTQYLLRFDDFCPTMNETSWLRFVPLLRRFGIQPILAVIPENHDPDFAAREADPEFWAKMRALQSEGATIGLHGYQHLCNSPNRIYPRNLLPFHRRTEFAGAPRDFQRQWIRAGIAILQKQGLKPSIWVAPRHGTDRVTLETLREVGIDVVSDGLATRPFSWHGCMWIPQQLWRPVEQGPGLWTICIHSETASDEFVTELEVFLERFAVQFTSVNEALDTWPIRNRSLGDRWFHIRTMTRIKLSRLRRGLRA